MPNGRHESPSTPRRHGFYDLEYSEDPFRPFSRHTNHPIIDLTDSPPLQMPKRKLSGAAATAHAAKKQRLSREQSAISQSRDSAEPPKTKYETVDLTLDSVEDWKTTRERREKEALEAQRAKEVAQKRPKLAEFECVICLENPTDLVVTHCGMCFQHFFRGNLSLVGSCRSLWISDRSQFSLNIENGPVLRLPQIPEHL